MRVASFLLMCIAFSSCGNSIQESKQEGAWKEISLENCSFFVPSSFEVQINEYNENEGTVGNDEMAFHFNKGYISIELFSMKYDSSLSVSQDTLGAYVFRLEISKSTGTVNILLGDLESRIDGFEVERLNGLTMATDSLNEDNLKLAVQIAKSCKIKNPTKVITKEI